MVMINEILASVRDTLESALQAGHSRDEDWLRLTNLGAPDGSAATDLNNSIVMTVAAFQVDASLGAYQMPRLGTGDSFGMASAPLFLDTYVLFVSCFADAAYATGLAALSRIIQFFQEHPVFDGAHAPDIDARMGPLAIEYASLDFAQASHLSSLAGLKGQPFLLYRLRRLPFAGPAIADVAPAVRRAPPAALLPAAT
ncbi:Pvc16 family protein [Sphingomonas xinjiangensis]|uniref:Pvc16 N-terminal domain-containing protein n=1 Tax=Sphingomonas xinjiangensis TaxID=643568 RepID=A0A840YQS0_9SPHN|nr:Pvc16 family protein [Sphingomonas xinjiangensis]MBB5710803.1 hypothetical protein [Sphingomonas xinjiangensis]